MGLDVHLLTERGDVLAQLLDPQGLVAKLIQHAPADSICLRFVDPYQDTTLNSRQAEQLVQELRDLDALPDDLHTARDSLVDLAERVETHVYLKFIGD